MNRLTKQLHFIHGIKDAKPQATRALLPSAGEDLIKAVVQCAIKSLNGNHKQSKEENSTLSTYKNRLRVLIVRKFGLKSKRKIEFENGFKVPLLTCILSGVIGTLINKY